MIVKISHQKATAISKKYFSGELPKRGQEGYLLPTGAKLRNSMYLNSYCIVCYTYNPKHLELKPLGINI